MKSKTGIIGLVGLVMGCVSLTSCERVAPNYIGVLMQDYGKAGKADFTTVKGRVSVMAPGTELFQVPLWEQRANFENPLTLQAADQTAFSSKPNYSYTVIEARAVDVVFQNKQLSSGEKFMKSLEDNILEMKIYDIMKEESRKFVTDSLMSKGGSLKFEQRVQDLVAKVFETKGLKLENFTAQLEFSEEVTKKIDSRNEINTNVTVIDQQIIEQRKRNELARLKAEENKIVSSGITQELLAQQALTAWDGKLPSTWSGSSLPFVKNIK